MNISQLIYDARISEKCVVPPVRLDPRDGRVIVTYDGLRITLHRLVWMLDGRELAPKDYLLRQCHTAGCVQPKHFVRWNSPRMGGRPICPNGHRYQEADVTPRGNRCRLCAEARNRRRRRGGKPHWMLEQQRQFCPQGHEYTDDNIYWEHTPRGGRKRHCKTCVRARRAGIDPADVTAA
jgi:hypothetical protein